MGSAPKSGGTTRFALPPNWRTRTRHTRRQMPMGVRQQPKSGYGAHPCDRRLRQRGVTVRLFGGIDHRCRLKQIDSRTNRMNLTIAFPCDNRLPVRPALMGKGVFRVRDSEFFLCHDTDHSLVASVSRRSSGSKMRILSSDTDGIGRWSVSRQEAGLRRLHFAAMPFAKVCAQDLP